MHLCSDRPLISLNNTCSPLHTGSSYYDLYSRSDYCTTGYPNCICQYACGPFIGDNNNIEAFRAAIIDISGLDVVWSGLFTYPYGPWVLVVALLLTAFILRNTLRVQYKLFAMKEKALTARIDALEALNKEKEKRLQKIKAFDTRASLQESFIVGT